MSQERRKRTRVHGDFVDEDSIITIESISEGGGIAYGRGVKAPVEQHAIEFPSEETSEIWVPTFEDLDSRITESELPPDLKAGVRSDLESLQAEVARGEEGDVQIARQTLKTISAMVPELREPLFAWVMDTEQTSTPIKIVARKLLT